MFTHCLPSLYIICAIHAPLNPAVLMLGVPKPFIIVAFLFEQLLVVEDAVKLAIERGVVMKTGTKQDKQILKIIVDCMQHWSWKSKAICVW